MPRASNITVQNSFIKGLVTEATALNFPENACTDVDNMVFDHLGNVTRRLGQDLEGGHVDTNQTLTGAVVVPFTWKNVAGEGDRSYAVVQIGETLHFYKVVPGQPLSGNKHSNTIALSTFYATGVTSVATLECQFAQGNGYLFVTNSNLEPFYVSYSTSGDTFSATKIDVKIRDFAGITETSDTARPTTLSDNHRYNLSNQGWPSRYLGTSSTSIAVGTGSKTFTTQSTLNIQVGDIVRVYSRATPGDLGASTSSGNIMIGPVTSYSSTTLIVNVTRTNGSGTLTDWNIVEEPDYIEAWSIVNNNYPSNSEVWWTFKDTSGKGSFNIKTGSTSTFLDHPMPSSPSEKGHFIFSAFNQDRATVSGITGLTAVTTGTARPSTCTFFAGRVWYGGVQYLGFNAKLYFSQIAPDPSKFGLCHQVNDPTNQDFFDILPSDGGVIDIIEAGTVLKLVPVLNNLMVVCTNGVWFITGSQGVGFTATDYSIHKISGIVSSSATSFVDVEGIPYWWSQEAIWTVTFDPQTNSPRIVPVTRTSIKAFYQTILPESINYARGVYDPEDHVIQWIYRSTAAVAFNDKYIYDSAINFNVLTQAFYPWSFSSNKVRVHGVISVLSQGGAYSQQNVTNSAVNVTDGGVQVTVFLSAQGDVTTSFLDKYVVSYISGGNTKFTFGENYRTDYKDWYLYDNVGESYSSFFVAGYMVRGQGMKKFQTMYVNFFSNADEPSTFRVRNQWNFSTSGSSGKWSTAQTLSGFFHARPQRIKLRGHGISCQFRVESIDYNPINLIGWSSFETGNQWV